MPGIDPFTRLAVLCAILAIIPMAAFSQVIGSPAPYPPATLTHELSLVLAGAVFGGFLGPILQAFDFWLGITSGAKQQRENYEVQREIAASLRQLVDAQLAASKVSDEPEV